MISSSAKGAPNSQALARHLTQLLLAISLILDTANAIDSHSSEPKDLFALDEFMAISRARQESGSQISRLKRSSQSNYPPNLKPPTSHQTLTEVRLWPTATIAPERRDSLGTTNVSAEQDESERGQSSSRSQSDDGGADDFMPAFESQRRKPELKPTSSSQHRGGRPELKANESRWIPVLANRQTSQSYSLPDHAELRAREGHHAGFQSHSRTNPHPRLNQARPHRAPSGPPRHVAQASGGSPRYQRRPRFNGHRISTSKMYKRVLLCDKTLVSLDYVRNLEQEHQPYGSFDELEDFEDNTVVLDTDLSLVVADPQSYFYNTSAESYSDQASDELRSASARSLDFERRSHLPDNDPLVRCDMWDLEKGSKNRKPPREILRAAIRVDFETVRDAINRCRQLSEKTASSEEDHKDGFEVMSIEDLLSLFSIKRGLIPGTKWCGLGDQAHSYNDLGQKQRIDLCCRAHDHCPIRLKPFRNDYGVINIALYTKSHCDCDADFYKCLRDVRSQAADMLGNLYFNVMKLQCLREERMKICRKMR